jgi:hypothetical protein
METLAYLHLALANDDQAFTDDTASISTPSRPQLFENLNQRKAFNVYLPCVCYP